MDYEPYDSSGTDDDLPPSHQNRVARGGGGGGGGGGGPRIAGNGRSGVMGSHPPYPRMYNESDMEAQIHQLEQEAYSSVLRAFKAQADAITWEKESLITELRKELRLSNEEHRELLGKVNTDEVICRIREWRQSGGTQQGMVNTVQPIHDPLPSPSVSASRKKQKITPSQSSFGGPSTFQSHPVVPQVNQPSSSTKRGSMVGPKGKKHKSGQMFPGAPSSTKMQQYPSTGGGRGQFGNRVTSGSYTSGPPEGIYNSSMIGRKVRTKWPDDNNFYEAVITDYNATEGRHALVYDMGTPNETWEWVNLSEISPDDIQWDGEDPGVVRHGGYGGGINRGVPGAGRGRGIIGKGHSRKEFPVTASQQNGTGGVGAGTVKKGPADIHLLHTDTLIKEVERVFSGNHPDPGEIDKAKKVLKEHEQALADAIARLGEISDGESDGGGRYMHGQAMDR